MELLDSFVIVLSYFCDTFGKRLGYFWELVGYFCLVLGSFGYSWVFLGTFGYFLVLQVLLVTFGYFWLLDYFWLCLVLLGTFCFL